LYCHEQLRHFEDEAFPIDIFLDQDMDNFSFYLLDYDIEYNNDLFYSEMLLHHNMNHIYKWHTYNHD